MNIPTSVRSAVRTALDANLSDIDAQKAAAKANVRDLPVFTEFVDALVDHAVEQILLDERGALNVQIRRAVRPTTGPAKVNLLESAGVRRLAAESLFNLMVGGKRLGDVTGAELCALVDNERAVANGHLAKAELLAWCAAQKVGPAQRVEDAIKLPKLKAAYLAIEARYAKAAEVA